MMQIPLSNASVKYYKIHREDPLSLKLYQSISVSIPILLHVRNVYNYTKNCDTGLYVNLCR